MSYRVRNIGLAPVFAGLLLLAACGKAAAPAEAPVEPFDAWSVLTAEPYGSATLELGVDTASIAAGEAGEGGVTLTLPPESEGTSAVFFT